MKYRLVVRSMAERDLADALQFYDGKVPGLGLKMLEGFDETIERVTENPRQFPTVYHDFRRAMVPRFPYGVFFMVKDDTILVARVLYLGRDPKLIRSGLN